mgnify:CR=1 FL=1
MKIDAIYDHGRLVLPEDIALKQHRVEVRVEIPDAALALSDTACESNTRTGVAEPGRAPAEGTFLDEMRAILAPVRAQLDAGGDRLPGKRNQRERSDREGEGSHRGQR